MSYRSSYNKRNKEKENNRILEWRKKNKERWKSYQKQYTQTEKRKDYIRNYSKLKSSSLNDNYIKDRLHQDMKGIVSCSDIPQDLIEIKRKALSLKRQIKAL